MINRPKMFLLFCLAWPSVASPAEIACSTTGGEVNFFFSGTGGSGPAILRINDLRYVLECSGFSCLAEPIDGIAIGVKLSLRVQNELIFARLGSPDVPIFQVQSIPVECEVN